MFSSGSAVAVEYKHVTNTSDVVTMLKWYQTQTLTYECSEAGHCNARESSSSGPLTKRFCERTCVPMPEALKYFENVQKQMLKLLGSIQTEWIPKLQMLNDEDQENTFYRIVCRVVQNDDTSIDVEWHVKPFHYNGKIQALLFKHGGLKFAVDLHRYPYVIELERYGFFYHEPYNRDVEQMSAENLFFFGETFALGCCTMGTSYFMSAIEDLHYIRKVITIQLNTLHEETSLTKRRRGKVQGDISFVLEILTSVWNMLWRGDTFYENKGYKIRNKEWYTMQVEGFMAKTILELLDVWKMNSDHLFSEELSSFQTHTMRDIVEAVVSGNGTMILRYLTLVYPHKIQFDSNVHADDIKTCFDEFQARLQKEGFISKHNLTKSISIYKETVSQLKFFKKFEIRGVKNEDDTISPLLDVHYVE